MIAAPTVQMDRTLMIEVATVLRTIGTRLRALPGYGTADVAGAEIYALVQRYDRLSALVEVAIIGPEGLS